LVPGKLAYSSLLKIGFVREVSINGKLLRELLWLKVGEYKTYTVNITTIYKKSPLKRGFLPL
jgi:hypothetical protein